MAHPLVEGIFRCHVRIPAGASNNYHSKRALEAVSSDNSLLDDINFCGHIDKLFLPEGVYNLTSTTGPFLHDLQQIFRITCWRCNAATKNILVDDLLEWLFFSQPCLTTNG